MNVMAGIGSRDEDGEDIRLGLLLILPFPGQRAIELFDCFRLRGVSRDCTLSFCFMQKLRAQTSRPPFFAFQPIQHMQDKRGLASDMPSHSGLAYNM